ncbi:MAG: hypothetical protein CVU56_28865 [Deltaproteobacteria bacterium HGW-Deltaproteobacteria-14]|nr:MAG: hypothetical protein CVU56_28865 [Deltaproteobacteria bacterium HGW-Deltaproteobacteria-14]
MFAHPTLCAMVASLGLVAACDSAPAGGPAADTTQNCNNLVTTRCDPSDLSRVFSVDACGVVNGVRSECNPGKECFQRTPTSLATCTDPVEPCDPFDQATICVYPGGQGRTLYETSYIAVGTDVACVDTPEDAGDLIEDCGFGSACFQEPGFNDGEALCHRSIDASQAGKPYYDFGCSKFSLWMRYPTKLEIDCRCRTVGDGQGGAGGTGNAMADPNNVDISNGARPGGPIFNCLAGGTMPTRTAPVQYGTGPSFNAWYDVNASGASWFSGVVNPETREMFAIIKFTDPTHVKGGAVVAWELDSGDRRIVSGIHPTAGEFGSGYLSPPAQGPFPFGPQPLTGANVIRFGPDKMLYVYGGGTGESTDSQRQVVRVDPTTGERTLVWRAQRDVDGPEVTADFGQCLRPEAFDYVDSVGMNAQAFEIGPDRTLYFAFRGVREGDGIMAVSPDGKTCTVLSRWGGTGDSPGGGATPVPAPEAIGAGPFLQFPVQGLLFHDGLIYGVSNSDLYSFDPATGDRVDVSYTKTTYGGMGFANMFWDPTREVIWAVGTAAAHTGTIVNLKNGRRESIFADTGRDEHGAEAVLVSVYPESRSTSQSALGNGNTIGYGGVVLDPDDNDIVYAVLKSGGLLKMELSTFNNYVHSW